LCCIVSCRTVLIVLKFAVAYVYCIGVVSMALALPKALLQLHMLLVCQLYNFDFAIVVWTHKDTQLSQKK